MKRTPKKNELKIEKYWNLNIDSLFKKLNSSYVGLTSEHAQQILKQTGGNKIKSHRKSTIIRSFFNQFTNPMILVLIFAAIISAVVSEWTDTIIIILIVMASAVISFIQEYMASQAVEKLQKNVSTKNIVLRDGQNQTLPTELIVPGDIIILSAGSLIPADGIITEANDFFVNQAVLTGETFPAEKKQGEVNQEANLSERINTVFMGTSAKSGSAKMLVVETGKNTAFGQIAERLKLRPPESEFERGIRKFGTFLTRIIIVLVFTVFIINTILDKPAIDSLLFAIALAVGIAPELLPAIITISLSKGAQNMAKNGVIVRRLNSIENLGSMDILCTDKTGTITEGVVKLDKALDYNGEPSNYVMRWAYLNSAFQTGMNNPLDEAIMLHPHIDTSGMDKLGEIPYDFVRKRMSVIIDSDSGSEIDPLLVTKGALDNVLKICNYIRVKDKEEPITKEKIEELNRLFAAWSEQGYRVLGLATKKINRKDRYRYELDEKEMVFEGFLLFFDPPKKDALETIAALAQIGVNVKIITGDNNLVAKHVAKTIGLPADSILQAEMINEMRDEALWNVAERTTIFSEVDPNQKERIILALRKMGHVVGYMGDGINDAPALHAADIGISVDSAVDVAKDAADFVLQKNDLMVLLKGIKEGRRTFANTHKYIFTTISANFGNMISMVGASIFLPFLPLLAKQILLNNFLSDFPAIGIPGDNVDEDMLNKPHKWNIKFIRNFMIVFGLVSSIFDYATFGLLIFIVKATERQFQTGWFIESLLTELVIALIVRTRHRFYKSKPGKVLWIITLVVSIITLLIPYLPYSDFLGFTPLPMWVMLSLVSITVLYVIASEATKKYFYAKFTN